MTARVTFGLPVRNGADYLEAALASIGNQTEADLEIVISDNASTDATADICREAAHGDERITYTRLPENIGAAGNYNRVLELATSPFFKWASHDDLIHPTFTTRCLAEFGRRGDECALVYPSAQIVNERDEVVGELVDRSDAEAVWAPVRAFQTMQGMSRVTSVFGVFRTPVLRQTRGIGAFISSDFVLLLETALLGSIVRLDGEVLFSRRVHPGMSRVANRTDREVQEWFDPHAAEPTRHLYREYTRSVWSVPGLGVPTRVAATAGVAGGVVTKRSRVALGRWRRHLTGRLGRQQE